MKAGLAHCGRQRMSALFEATLLAEGVELQNPSQKNPMLLRGRRLRTALKPVSPNAQQRRHDWHNKGITAQSRPPFG